MKKKISRILGVGLAIMLLTSLLVVVTPGAPASASVLSVGTDAFLPSPLAPGYIMTSLEIVDMAVNGSTVYAAVSGNDTFLKSTNAGASWVDLSQSTDFPGGNVDLVAVAPDDPNIVVIVTDLEVPYYSSDGGASWITLGKPKGTATPAAVINDIAVSGLTGGYTYVVVGGTDGTDAELYTMKLAMAQGWVAQYGKGNASGNSTASQAAIKTVALSPNFQIDKIVGVVSYDAGTTSAYFQCFRYEEGAETWNGAIAYFESWRTATTKNGIELGEIDTALQAASIAYLPTFDGTDDGERIAFVGWADSATPAEGGAVRLTDTYGKAITTWSAAPLGATNSLAYHEAGKLLIGDFDENQVYACLSPMATTPMCERVNSMKQPGGTNMTTVGWIDDTAIASTRGNESCFSISDDDAYSFNDISMLNTTLGAITDVAVSADAAVVYVASYDSDNDVSIWLNKPLGYIRVLSMKGVASGTEDIAIRMAPDDPTAVYINARDKQDMWVSKDSGKNSWKSIPCYKLSGVQDFVVESADILYAISTSGLSKSTNGGRSWTVEKSFEGEVGNMITLAPNNDILIGCQVASGGDILYSKDGGSTIVNGGAAIFPFAMGDAIVVADTNYADNGIIYTSDGAQVGRGVLGPGGMYSARGIELPDATGLGTDQVIKGLAVAGDVLYALAGDGTSSELYKALNIRDATDKAKALWSRVCYPDNLIGFIPQPLKIAPNYFDRTSSSTMPNLYAVGSSRGAPTVRSFADALSTGGITLKSPTAAAKVDVNPVSGRAYDLPFSWERFHSAEIVTCQYQVATDANFDALVVQGASNLTNGLVTGITTDLISVIVGPTGAVTSQFMPNTTYYWRVRVSQIRGPYPTYAPLNPWLSPWSETRSFRVEGEIPFSIISPEVGATGVSTTPTLSWTEYPGAASYEVQVADGSIPEGLTFTILDVSHSAENTFYHIEEALKYSNTYYWRVRPTGVDLWVTGSFTTEAEPTEPEPTVIVTEKPAPPAQVITLPAPPAEEVPVIPDYLLWTIVGIGAVLLIALIVLIVRTRRVV